MAQSAIPNLDVLVKDNIRILSLPKETSPHPLAIILVGPPFSGKTALVETLSQKFPLVVLSESQMGAFLAPRATFFKRGEDEIFLLASKTMEELVRMGYNCIYDASIKKRKDRLYLQNLVTNAKGKMALITCVIPENEVYARLQKRNSEIVRGDRKGFIMDKDLMKYELNSIEPPTKEEHPFVYQALANEEEKIIGQVGSMLAELSA